MGFDVWALFDAFAGRDDPLQAMKERTTATLDAVLARMQAGARVSGTDLKRCGEALDELHDSMMDEHGTRLSSEFPLEDQADFYLEAVKLSALGHPNHTMWPVLAEMRRPILPVLQARLAKAATPWLACATIQPALCAGEIELARDCYRRIAEVPFFAKLVRRWCDEALMINPEGNREEVTREFAAGLPEQPDPWNASASSVPADRRWLLLASTYPFLTFDPRLTLGPPMSMPTQRNELEDDWGIRDPETAAEMLAWLLHEGHSAILCTYLEGRRRAIPAAAFEYLDGRRPVPVIEDKRKALERHVIRAWDLSRLIATTRSAFAVGYLDEAAAWQWLLAAGDAIRQTYTSWKDFGEDCILGCKFFEEANHTSAAAHVAMLRWLLADPRSPWARVAFGGPAAVPGMR
jgi:hypothetical protein